MIELSEECRTKLNYDIDIAVKMICEKMDKPPDAILLCGGYGRDEGGWLRIEGKIRPYNDYDFAIITDSPLSREKTNNLRTSIAEKVGIKWIDIDYYSLKSLRKLKPTIHNYDLVFGSKVVFGDTNIVKKCKTILPQSITKKDIMVLYKTRIWTFLGSWDGRFCDLNACDGCFFRNQMAKAILAACDMTLVKQKKYTVSYRKRSEICKSIFNGDQKIISLINFAIKEKLHPSFMPIKNDEMETLFFSVKDFFVQCFEKSYGLFSKFYINPTKTIIAEKYSFKNALRCLKHFFLKDVSVALKSIDVFLAQNYVFNAIGSLNDNIFIREANKLMIKWGYLEEEENDVFVLKGIVAKARNDF